jgi:hypothetical protein
LAKLYANENFPLPVVEALRRLGHDVLTIQDTGRASTSVPDPEVLRFAVAENRAVLTLNRRHFIALHKRSGEHCGIVVCSVDPDPQALAARIHEAIERTSPLDGQLLRINRPAR